MLPLAEGFIIIFHLFKLSFKTFQPELMSLPISGITDLVELESRLFDIDQIFESTLSRLQLQDFTGI